MTSWSPLRRLGAPSPGGLALPPASPTGGHLYAPRGIWTDGERVVVADTGHHRVLIWLSRPERDGVHADVVLGQPTRTSEGPAAAGRGPQNGLNLPTGVTVVDGCLVVADAWHHRILVWDGVPEHDDLPPASVLGQPDPLGVEPNAGGDVDATTLYWPFGVASIGGVFWVADTGNRRVLGWRCGADRLPRPGAVPDVLLGQPSVNQRSENRGGSPSARSYRWPHALAGDDHRLLVADAGNHRVLGFAPVPTGDTQATLVLGQPDAHTAAELAYQPQGASRLRFPYAIDQADGRLAVADTANNRVLVWDAVPAVGCGTPADTVLGQPDFDAHGENRWDRVGDDTLCWPYGLSWSGGLLAIADSGNNRAMIWEES